MNNTLEAFTGGIHNQLDSSIIPKDALSDATGWITEDGVIELARGRVAVNATGAEGSVKTQHFAYTTAGEERHYRKTSTKIQYDDGTTWVDVITGLSEGGVSFANYQSLAGSFVYIFCLDGIYKIHTSNPTDYVDVYDPTKNFKGYALINLGRTILWGEPNDRTGLYGSHTDVQKVGDSYTSVTAEATTSLTGTLAFKAGDPVRTCFALELTLTGTGEVYTDDFNGVLTGDMGGVGTINYMTGAYTLTNAGVGTVNYKYENSNTQGVTDFTESVPRVAGEGFILRQDEGGDAILSVKSLDGSYYSMKERSVYQLTIDTDDLNPDNAVFRTDVGISNANAAVSTGKGIVFIDTANKEEPQLTVLERNPIGDKIEPLQYLTHFKFDDYDYSDCVLETYGQFVLISCKTEGNAVNNRILVCNIPGNTVSIVNYGADSFSKDGGFLYSGDSLSESTYQTLSGFDDLDEVIENYAITRYERMDTEDLKKVKKMRFKGLIAAGQVLAVYAAFNKDDFQLIGTIRSDGGYVDKGTEYLVGTNLVGEGVVGGSGGTSVYPYTLEMKVKTPKFLGRQIKFVAESYGYVSVQYMSDRDVWKYQDKLPAKYRQKQNVSLDGTTTNNANPSF